MQRDISHSLKNQASFPFEKLFVGGSYLAKYLSGSSDSDEEKRRHDLAVEKYQKEYEEYEENRAKFNDWIMTNDRIKDEVKENFKNTDYAISCTIKFIKMI